MSPEEIFLFKNDPFEIGVSLPEKQGIRSFLHLLRGVFV